MSTIVTTRSEAPSFPRTVLSPRFAGLRVEPWWLLTAWLIVGDALALAAAFGVAYAARFHLGVPFLEVLPQRLAFYSTVAFATVPAWLGLFALYGLYDRRRVTTGGQEYTRLWNACTVGVLAVILISFLDVTLVISRAWVLLTWVLSMLLVGAERWATRSGLRWLRRQGLFLTPTLIVGTNPEAQALAEQLLEDPACGARVLGFIERSEASSAAGGSDLESRGAAPVLGGLEDLRRVVRAYGVQKLVIATTALERAELLDLYQSFGQDQGIELHLSSGLYEILTTGLTVEEIGNVPLMSLQRVRITGPNAALKLLADYVIALLALVVLSPALLLIGLLVRLDSPGPALHRRRVLGQSGRHFDAFKFRTMRVDADEVLARDPELRRAFEQGYKLKVDPRVTRLGRFLRRSSLDELPQLLNVLRGEMSLVGPRMIAPDEAPRYGKWQLNLLTVKPGITGPWQVQGRSDLPYADRVRLSMQYIRNYSLWLDLRILAETAVVVLRGRGAY